MTTSSPRVLAFAGALRKASFNKKLLAATVERARARGADVDVLDLADVAMPFYDGDLEAAAGLPPGAVELRRRITAAQALIIATPEYNASVSGVLKNAIDWASRPPSAPFRGKVALLLAATPGMGGGARALPDLRKILSGLGAFVLPGQLGLAKAHEAFDDAGHLTVDQVKMDLDRVVDALVDVTRKLNAG